MLVLIILGLAELGVQHWIFFYKIPEILIQYFYKIQRKYTIFDVKSLKFDRLESPGNTQQYAKLANFLFVLNLTGNNIYLARKSFIEKSKIKIHVPIQSYIKVHGVVQESITKEDRTSSTKCLTLTIIQILMIRNSLQSRKYWCCVYHKKICFFVCLLVNNVSRFPRGPGGVIIQNEAN